MSNNFIVPNSKEIIKKEAIGIDESELGEVEEVNVEYIITQTGTMYKDKFYIPKHLVERFDGHYVWFRIIGEKGQKLKRD
jgi:hypothetical protein